MLSDNIVIGFLDWNSVPFRETSVFHIEQLWTTFLQRINLLIAATCTGNSCYRLCTSSFSAYPQNYKPNVIYLPCAVVSVLMQNYIKLA